MNSVFERGDKQAAWGDEKKMNSKSFINFRMMSFQMLKFESNIAEKQERKYHF